MNENYLYILIDLETTGLDVKTNRICSIGACVYDNEELNNNNFQTNFDETTRFISNEYEFYSYVNPLQINYGYHINNISDEILRESNTFPTVINLFWNWLINLKNIYSTKEFVFIGHNIDNFDELMLLSEIRRSKISLPDINFYKIDTMKIFKYLFPITLKSIPYSLTCLVHCPDSYKQSDIYKFLYNHEPNNQHNALGDVRTLLKILKCNAIKNIIFMCEPENSKLY